MSKRPRTVTPFSPPTQNTQPGNAEEVAPEEHTPEEHTPEEHTPEEEPVAEESAPEESAPEDDEFITLEEVQAPHETTLQEPEVLDFTPTAEDLLALQDAELASVEPEEVAPESAHERAQRLGSGYFEDDGYAERPDIQPDHPLPEITFSSPSSVDDQRLAEFHAGRAAREAHLHRHEHELALGRRMVANTDISRLLPDKDLSKHF